MHRMTSKPIWMVGEQPVAFRAALLAVIVETVKNWGRWVAKKPHLRYHGAWLINLIPSPTKSRSFCAALVP